MNMEKHMLDGLHVSCDQTFGATREEDFGKESNFYFHWR